MASRLKTFLSTVLKRPGAKPQSAPLLGRYRKEVSRPLADPRHPQPEEFPRTIAYYADMLDAVGEVLSAGEDAAAGDRELLPLCLLTAEWGMIFRGKEAQAFALRYLRSHVPELREAGAAVLEEIGRDDDTTDALVFSMEREVAALPADDLRDYDLQPLDAMMQTAGRLRCRTAIPVLAKLLHHPALDADTRAHAVFALGKIVRHRFDHQPDPLAAAMAWLDQSAKRKPVRRR